MNNRRFTLRRMGWRILGLFLAFLALSPTALLQGETSLKASSEGGSTEGGSALKLLRQYIEEQGLGGIEGESFATTPLSAWEAEEAEALLWQAQAKQTRNERADVFASRVLEHDGLKMPFWYTTYGDPPGDGRSLYISMHGGGGAPSHVNDSQWENQKRLYEPDEGVYLVPRAPTNTWNLWHQAHIDRLFDRLIADLIVFENVNPDRVYLMGYSAGGDGVYQLAPRISDRFAAAAMMAGHPNDANVEGLRNIPFTLHMGERDTPYGRNVEAQKWKDRLAELQEQDPGGYLHLVKIHEGKGHWMEREDAVAVPWMAQHRRSLHPERIVWIQHAVPHSRYYWLAVSQPVLGARTVVEREGQTIEIVEWQDQGDLALRLDDASLDLEAPVVVMQGDRELFRGRVDRTIATLAKTLKERNDPRGMFSAEVVVTPPVE
ncbi:MAG: dienelactone hydrolase family protein [Opitutales bacterium]